jgi:hypothetical protein
LAGWLADIPVDVAMLPLVTVPGPAGLDSVRSKSPYPPLAPIRLEVAALTDTGRGGAARDRGDELWFEEPDVPSVLPVLHAWAEELRCDLDPGRQARWGLVGFTVQGEAGFLTAALDRLAGSVWVGDAHREIGGVWRALRSAHGDRRPKPLGDCLTVTDGQECGGRVWPDRWGGSPACARCKRVYTRLDLVRLQIMVERAESVG